VAAFRVQYFWRWRGVRCATGLLTNYSYRYCNQAERWRRRMQFDIADVETRARCCCAALGLRSRATRTDVTVTLFSLLFDMTMWGRYLHLDGTSHSSVDVGSCICTIASHPNPPYYAHVCNNIWQPITIICFHINFHVCLVLNI